MERVMTADITDYLLKHKLLSPQQHGFLAKRSTLTNLLETTNDWNISIDNKLINTVIYIDFSKAFDTVSHPKLLTKLQSCGITGDLLSVINDFLQNRSQRTRVGNQLSNEKFLTSGVVQGSCLGPLLFLLFINDISTIFQNPITSKLYADDLKLYTTTETIHDSQQLQRCLDSLHQWSQDWQLTISIKKCQTIHIGSQALLSKRLRQQSAPEYRIGDDLIPNVDSLTDLGITMDCNIKFSEHISNIVRKAASRCYLIRKCFISKDTPTLVKAFKIYVRPLLEYNSPVWSPHLLKDITLIEKVQRRFTKYMKGLFNMPYSDRLKVLNLERLEARRIKADVITAYKIIFGLTIIDSSNFFSSSQYSIGTRGHEFKLIEPTCHCDTFKFCFASRVIHIWNSLPRLTTDFSSVFKFKNSISDSFYLNHCTGPC